MYGQEDGKVIDFVLRRTKPFTYVSARAALKSVNKGTVSSVLSNLTKVGLVEMDRSRHPYRYSTSNKLRMADNPHDTAKQALSSFRSARDSRIKARKRKPEAKIEALIDETGMHHFQGVINDAAIYRRIKPLLLEIFKHVS